MNIKRYFRISIIATALLTSTGVVSQAQSLKDILGGFTGSQESGSGLSNGDITAGLKEALSVGAKNASNQLANKDGFFRNAAIKILLPQEVQVVESQLRKMGLGSIVDDAILKLNRAAEDASKKAAPIFVNAITSMSIVDGINILKGSNNAATQYLQRTTTAGLTSAFRPTIQNSLNKVGAVTAWNKVFTTYNKIPLVRKINPDLTGYVTEKALFGLFQTIAQEELKIRTDPAAQISNILKKVFGKN
jgi:hypothetical protein